MFRYALFLTSEYSCFKQAKSPFFYFFGYVLLVYCFDYFQSILLCYADKREDKEIHKYDHGRLGLKEKIYRVVYHSIACTCKDRGLMLANFWKIIDLILKESRRLEAPQIAKVVRCFLIEPFPESALNEQAGKMLLEDYDEYARYARLYTGIHAQKLKRKPVTAVISESKTAINVEQTKQIPSGKIASSPPPQPGLSEQGQNTVPVSDNIVGASTVKAAASSAVVKKGIGYILSSD